MGISVKIHNVKNIDDFSFDIPTEKGLYALTGEVRERVRLFRVQQQLFMYHHFMIILETPEKEHI